MDNARKKTDKLLQELERRIEAIYRSDPSLLRLQRKYDKYMANVEASVADEYYAYKTENDREEKKRLKQIYKDKVWSLTKGSRVYNDIVSDYVSAMANVNQRALDMINAEMPEIYVLNYNQIADTCKIIGVTVDE